MPLNVAKVTLSFQQGAYGWTESYFLDSPSSDLQTELQKGYTLAQKRANMIGFQTFIPYIKVSNENVSRDVNVQGSSMQGPEAYASDAPTTALLFRKFASNNVINSITFLRGVWDEVILKGGEFDYGNAAFMAYYNAFKSYLAAANFGFLARNPAVRQQSPVSNVGSNIDNTLQITTANNVFVGIAAGTKLKVFVSGVRGAGTVNGPQIVVVTGNNGCHTLKPLPILPYTGGGVLSFNTVQFYKIASGAIERVVERKVGRPLYLSRGRRPGRKLV